MVIILLFSAPLPMISRKWEIRPSFTPNTKQNLVWISPSQVTANMATAVYFCIHQKEIGKEQEATVYKKMRNQLKVISKCAIQQTWKFSRISAYQSLKRIHNKNIGIWTGKNPGFYHGPSIRILNKLQQVSQKANWMKTTPNKICNGTPDGRTSQVISPQRFMKKNLECILFEHP